MITTNVLPINQTVQVHGIVCCVFVSFERVFDVQTKQDEVFDAVARPVIDKLVIRPPGTAVPDGLIFYP